MLYYSNNFLFKFLINRVLLYIFSQVWILDDILRIVYEEQSLCNKILLVQ